jgi:hypothetical protein
MDFSAARIALGRLVLDDISLASQIHAGLLSVTVLSHARSVITYIYIMYHIHIYQDNCMLYLFLTALVLSFLRMHGAGSQVNACFGDCYFFE